MVIPRTLGLLALLVAAPLAAQQGAPARDRAAGPDSARAAADTARASVVRAPAAAPAAAPAPITPTADQTRGVDAELQAALFDFSMDRDLAALSRLEWLRGAIASAPAGSVAPRASEDVLFALAEVYYRLGMSDAFRGAAQALATAPGATGRYQPLVAAQLMLDAYRRGDYAKALELASGAGSSNQGLAALVAGLAAYQTRDWAGAHEWFGKAAAGGEYAPYARYMDALATLQGDTTRAAAALQALEPLASGSGDVADQARVTAATLAYQLGHYDDAAARAAAVSSSSGFAPQAALTRAWALYRGGKLADARAAFAEFAAKYPHLPRRDEARLMVGQILLESKHADSAAAYFDAMSDSIGGEATALQAHAAEALGEAARALVGARAAGVVFLADPQTGRALELASVAGADAPRVIAAVAGGATPTGTAPPAHLVAPADIEQRLDQLGPALGEGFPRRLVFAPAGGDSTGAAYAMRAQALVAADVAVALARYRVQEQLAAQEMKIAALEHLQHLVADGRQDLDAAVKQMTLVQDSLARMRTILDQSRARARQMLMTQIDATHRMADENLAKLDSVRASLGTSVNTADDEILATEVRTATTYKQMADAIAQHLDAAIDRRPAFALRDSLGTRLAHAQALRDSTDGVLASNEQYVQGELAAARAQEAAPVRSARAAVTAAEAQRAAAESQLVALVDGELRARAGAAVALLGHDREVADYGSASAAFFKAIDADTPSAGTTGPAVGAATSRGAAAPPRQ